MAATMNNTPLLRFFLEAGLSPNNSRFGMTPIIDIESTTPSIKPEILDLLLQYGATKENCKPGIDVVLWDNIIDISWLDAQLRVIVVVNPDVNPNTAGHPFLKRISQAFAEASKGDTYVYTPEINASNNDLNQELAWGGGSILL
ncbi:MAG: hypothetical protein Q9184_007686 [Pyrenodesmia sp. 2 TL-2023]